MSESDLITQVECPDEQPDGFGIYTDGDGVKIIAYSQQGDGVLWVHDDNLGALVKALMLIEQRRIHAKDLAEHGLAMCGYECLDCGLCTKYSHSRHKAGPCLCYLKEKS